MNKSEKSNNSVSFGWSKDEEDKLKTNISKYGYDWMRVCEGLNRSWQSCRSKWYTSTSTTSKNNIITNIVTDSKGITTRSKVDTNYDKHHQEQFVNKINSNKNSKEKDKSISSNKKRNNLFHSSSYFYSNNEIKINHKKNVVTYILFCKFVLLILLIYEYMPI